MYRSASEAAPDEDFEPGRYEIVSLPVGGGQVSENHVQMRDVRRFMRENPQVLVLLLICLILGLGTFVIVLFGIASSGPHAHLTGEPSGSIAMGHGMTPIAAW